MYLQHVFMSGFKSYSNSSPKEIAFINGINCIVGPNGKGKSNVVDAICFALGLEIKLLRVSKLEDLITTRGSERESYACVQLLFSRDDENNTMHDEQGFSLKHELSVTLFKEKGIRKYKLDGKHVTLRAVQNFLFQHGLRHSSNFVIFQNHVVSLMFKGPKEIAEMITDGSGGLSFEHQAEKTLNEIEAWKQTEEHLNEQIVKLEKMIAEDKDKLAIVNERKKCEHDIAEARLALSLKRRSELEDHLEKDLNMMEELNVRKTDNGKRKQQLESEIACLALDKLISEMASLKTENIIPMQKQMSEMVENLELIKEEVDQLNNNYCSLLNEKSKVEDMKKHQELEKENLRDELRIINSKISTITSLLNSEQTQTPNQVEDVHELQQQIEWESKFIMNQKEKISTIKSNIQKLQDSIRKNDLAINQKSQNLTRTTIIESEDISLLKHEYSMLKNEYNKLKDEIERDDRYLNSLEISQDFKTALVNMISVGSSSHEYILPLSVIMGRNFSTHIVETSSQSERLLQIASQRKRSVTIWPLDRLDSSQQKKKIAYQRQIREKRGLNFIIPKDIIKFDEKIENSIDRCFGDFVISPTEDISKQLIELGISSVTLNGVKHLPGRVIGGDLTNIYENSAIKKRATVDQRLNTFKLLELDMRKKESILQEMESSYNYARQEQEILSSLNENNMLMAEELHDSKIAHDLLLNGLEQGESKLVILKQSMASCRNCHERQESLERLRIELRSMEDKRNEIELDLSKNVNSSFPEELVKQMNEKIIQKEQLIKSISKDLDIMKVEYIAKREYYLSLKVKKTEQEKKNKLLNDELATIRNSVQLLNEKIQNLEKSIKKQQKIVNQMGEITFMTDDDENSKFNDKSVEDLEVIVESLEKKAKSLAKKSKAMMVDMIDLEKKQAVLENSKSRLSWISKSCEVLEKGIASAQQVVEKYNEVAFEKVQQLFQKYTELMLPNKIASLRKVGEKVAEGIEIIVKSKNSNKEGDTSQLSLISGGEKTMVSLAFLFSIATFKKSMFYILDECDANLDEEKQKLVSRILSRMFKNQQVILISHNSAVQNEADCIIHV